MEDKRDNHNLAGYLHGGTMYCKVCDKLIGAEDNTITFDVFETPTYICCSRLCYEVYLLNPKDLI